MHTQTFRHFDEYAAALGHRNLRLIALARERAPWETCRVDLDGVAVRVARDGGPCRFDVAIDADGVAFLVADDGAGRMTGNGTFFGKSSVMVIPGHSEVRSTSLDTVTWRSLFVPASRLALAAEQDSRSAPRRVSVIDATTLGAAALRDTLIRVTNAAMQGAFVGNPLGAQHASRQLVAATRLLLGASGADDATQRTGRPRLSRAEIVGRVETWLEERHYQTCSLHDLARAAGVADRTLHNVFCEQLGVSPKRFLRLRLLNAVHRELRRADPGTSRVTDVMAGLGIWDWGRVAGEYRALFGELPSATLSARTRSR